MGTGLSLIATLVGLRHRPTSQFDSGGFQATFRCRLIMTGMERLTSRSIVHQTEIGSLLTALRVKSGSSSGPRAEISQCRLTTTETGRLILRSIAHQAGSGSLSIARTDRSELRGGGVPAICLFQQLTSDDPK